MKMMKMTKKAKNMMMIKNMSATGGSEYSTDQAKGK